MTSASAEVTDTVHALAECWNQHDMNAVTVLFAQDVEFVNVIGLWWKSCDEIRKAHWFAHARIFKNSHPTITAVAVRFPAADLAIARARWVLEGALAPDGSVLPARMDVLLKLLARSTDAWNIVDLQDTDIVEGALSRPQ